MNIKQLIFILFLISTSLSADQFSKADIKKMGNTFKKIENVGRIKNDCCNGNKEIKKSPSKENLNTQSFAAQVTSLPDHATLLKTSRDRQCAKGVRTSLNILFGKPANYAEDKSKYGRPAKDYNEKIFQQWRTATSCFKNVQDNNKDFKDYDIRVIQPKDQALAGHIEIYYKGIWHSDFKQDGTYWTGPSGETWKSCKLYRLSSC